MQLVVAEPITRASYAPFGALVAAGGRAPRIGNHGTAEVWDDLAELVSTRGEGARPTLSLFRSAPRRAAALEVRWLERHPFSTQLFVPMTATRYLVVVAQGGSEPDLASLSAFLVRGDQALTYAPGIWHHPIIALDRETDFVSLLFADGTSEDCEECAFDPACARVVIG